jgi:hypothetical protein
MLWIFSEKNDDDMESKDQKKEERAAQIKREEDK